MSAPVLPVALVGPGWSGRRLLRALTRLPGYRVEAVVGRGPGELSLSGCTYEVLARDAYPEVLARPGLSAVLICTPPAAQVALAEAALLAGHHVLVEKPVGLDPAGAAALVKAARDRGLVLAVPYHWLYNPLIERAAEAIAGGAIGRPVHATFRMFVPRTRPAPAWLRSPETSGGPFVETLVHGFHLMETLLGPAETVLSAAEYRDGEAVVGGTATLRHTGGCVTVLETTWLGTNAMRSGFFDVAGTEGSVSFDRGLDDRRRHTLRVQSSAGNTVHRGDDDDAGFAGLLTRFRDACLAGEAATLPGDHGSVVRALTFALAARRLAGSADPEGEEALR
ncbi:Gfo/Idh/MocA family protein [Actinomadura macrotermitis]|uniref:Inositol 2-dehydrogenase/D-chiro-inositol 3-dehydrogenase n=1 Tax=Actinomadura macrotermitis TaxID=2585200 RepID=A0A7K0BUZ4_9ACTN|nr:Gfo/Idh/MocA family oxidoreductase [Actinomadura macrotermitis]MQY05030.1 Inositol 2-dehydrogenase/D-chiro-inositol 3-dehydrogenase [Actinomadura macrotermitis]